MDRASSVGLSGTASGESRNVQITIEYDGTRYHGWQSQPGVPTIEGEIVRAIRLLTGERVRLIGSGRTDRGVHALGQEANFLTRTQIRLDRIPPGLNAHLPEDIVVRDARERSLNFHARHCAVSKTYRYTLLNRSQRSPLYCHLAHWVRIPLDDAAMRDATRFLLGRQDFRAFVTEARVVEDTVREIFRVTVERQGDFVYFDVEGTGFLYNMVRTIAGTLLLVGKGKLPPEGVGEILLSRDRRRAGAVLPARGLTLLGVRYPDSPGDART